MTNDEIREGKWWVHEALFHTIPCRDKVLVSFQKLIPKNLKNYSFRLNARFAIMDEHVV